MSRPKLSGRNAAPAPGRRPSFKCAEFLPDTRTKRLVDGRLSASDALTVCGSCMSPGTLIWYRT